MIGSVIGKQLGKYGQFLGKGLIGELAPSITKGVLVEVLKASEVDRRKATGWVENDVRLWDVLEPGHQKALRDLAQKVGNMEWVTAEWFIQAIKGDFPSVASLFLGWRKGRNWLERQIEIIKKEVA